MTYSILALRDHPERNDEAIRWFHSKWGVPEEAYRESIQDCQKNPNGVPQWYLAMDEAGEIAGGLGVIENDFHKRKDLAPNICAVYVEKAARGQGLARRLLDHICMEMKAQGLEDVYLITTHTEFYEHCGFSFLRMVEEDDGGEVRMYHRDLRTL